MGSMEFIWKEIFQGFFKEKGEEKEGKEEVEVWKVRG